jgi:hypothetical protein
MPAFDVTINPSTLDGTRGKRQTIVVTATNRMGRQVMARAVAVVNPPSAAAWVTPPPDAQRVFNQPNATEKFSFGFMVDANAKAGNYTVRIDVVDVDNQDDNFGQSPVLAVQVPEVVVAPPPPPPPFKWWILVVAAVVVLGIGFAVWKIFFSAKRMPDLVKKPYAEAVASLDTARYHIRLTQADTLADTTTFGRGMIVSQSIEAGKKFAADSNPLRLVVQEDFVVVPDLTGQEPTPAGVQLGAARLGFNNPPQPEYTTSHVSDEGKVVRTDPVKGTVTKSGTKVTLFVRTFTTPCETPICRFHAVVIKPIVIVPHQ